MTDDERRAAVALELRHAKSALSAARLLDQAALHNDALSRLYYALFHTMTALLVTEGVEPRRHRSLPGLLGSKFSASGLLTAADIAAVSRAATYRDLADYERTWEATPDVTSAAFAEIVPIIDRAVSHLASTGWTPPSPSSSG